MTEVEPSADPITILHAPATYLAHVQKWVDETDFNDTTEIAQLAGYLGELMVAHAGGAWQLTPDGKTAYVLFQKDGWTVKRSGIIAVPVEQPRREPPKPFFPYETASILVRTEHPDIAQWMQSMKA